MKRLALAAGVLLLAGCGNGASTTAADQLPGLGERLEHLDSFVSAHAWAKARAELRGLIADANAARSDGELDEAAADRVVASAQRLLAALPGPTPTPGATASSTPTAGAPSGTQPARDDHKGKGSDDKGGTKGKGRKH